MGRTDDAIERLTAWLRDYGNTKTEVFFRDMAAVLQRARYAQQYLDRMAVVEAENERLRGVIRCVILGRWSVTELQEAIGFENEQTSGNTE